MLAIGGGLPSVLSILVLAVAWSVLWSREHPAPDSQTVRVDGPTRLLRWAVGLLGDERLEWGEAMLGELESIGGRASRWRFALGCVPAILMLPPWAAAGPMVAMVVLALGSAVVFAVGFVHFGLAANPWNWVLVVILVTLVVGVVVGVSVQVRRPVVSRLGLVAGVVVAAAWLGFSGFTWEGILNPIGSVGAWTDPIMMIGVPLVVGAVAAWRGGSASIGRRAARLAGVSAGLTMFFVSTIAVVAIDGGPRDPGAGVAGGVSEAFSQSAMLYLIAVPLSMTAIGWVAATATARLGPLRLVTPGAGSVSLSVAEGHRGQRRPNPAAHQTLRRVAVAVAIVMVAVLFALAR